MNSNTKKLLFIHIPKTAGMSLHYELERIYGQEHTYRGGCKASLRALDEMSASDLEQYSYISAHAPLRRYERKKACLDWSKIALVRDPVERVVSAWSYVQNSGHPDHEKLRGMSLSEWVKGRPANTQCFFLGGAESFDAARKAIEQKFMLVAPVTEYAAFIERLSNWLGVPIPVTHANANSKRPGLKELDPELVASLREASTEDAALYRYVCDRF